MKSEIIFYSLCYARKEKIVTSFARKRLNENEAIILLIMFCKKEDKS